MNTNLSHSFQVPPASLQSIPYIMLIVLVPMYEVWFVPFMRKYTRKESGIDPLTRVGVGLFLVTFSMVAAACVERKRRDEAVGAGKIISIFWIAPQFLIFGLSEMFTAVGLIEFFYKQSLEGTVTDISLTFCCICSVLVQVGTCNYEIIRYKIRFQYSRVNMTRFSTTHGILLILFLYNSELIQNNFTS
jgi:POT family